MIKAGKPGLEEVRKVIALRDLPDEHLQWIIDHSELWEMEEGEVLTETGKPIDHMWLIIEGAMTFYMDINGQQVYFFTFENSEQTGGAGGLLPYSRMKAAPGFTYAAGKVRALALHKDYFRELENLNPNLIQRLIAYMTDRARAFATMQLQHEKVSALGKLSAGIAHELNNPASAISRLVEELNNNLLKNFDLTKLLLLHCKDPSQIDALRQMLIEKEGNKVRLSARQRMEAEDILRDWLEAKGVEDLPQLYETFAQAGITTDDLEKIYSIVGGKPFRDVVLWFENLQSSQKILADLGFASSRISKLVGAIKSHVHMDRTNAMEPTDIVGDIENTLMLLGHKFRDKNITIEKEFGDSLPTADAYVGELNQVWMNLFDNAVYAMDKNGKLRIEIFQKNGDIKVNIIDSGKGIPADVMPRIFDPFFTTKKVGDGTGIGLDIVRRIIRRHRGDIKVKSEPGRTEFSICIPIHRVIKGDRIQL